MERGELQNLQAVGLRETGQTHSRFISERSSIFIDRIYARENESTGISLIKSPLSSTRARAAPVLLHASLVQTVIPS